LKTPIIVLLVVVGIVGFLLVAAFIGGVMLPASNSLDSGIHTNTTPAPYTYSTPIPTQIPSKNIAVSYWMSEKQSITWSLTGGYSSDISADSGKIFVEISLTVKNNGYDSFNTNPYYFYLIADGVKYDVDSNIYLLDNWDTVDIMNGGKTQGSILFQVPSSAKTFALGYDALFKSYNIVWTETIPITPIPDVSPTPTSSIGITYSTLKTDSITYSLGSYSYDVQADNGKTFVKVQMTIRNNGYESFNTNPYYFYLTSNSIKYDIDSNFYLLDDWDTVDVMNGGIFTGTLLFQVPLSDSSFTVGYNAAFKIYNVIWSKT
jgi:hypothetical protein